MKKTLKKLCAISLFMMLGVMNITASNLSQKITLQVKNASLFTVLEEISKQSNFEFAYSKEVVNLNHTVTLDIKEAELNYILRELLKGQPISYKLIDNKIYLQPLKPAKEAQDQKIIKINGYVSDTSTLPLIGVNVAVKGTSNGTITDLDGKFSLDVPINSILQFSYIGYLPQEVIVKDQSPIKINLIDDTQKLDEVVVIGYGTQKKVNLTGSVAAIDGETLQKRPVVNATQSLQGLIPGLNVSTNNNSGKPGSSLDLNIRGKGNLDGGDKPYVLVDGLEMSLGDVNPNDIENISVLKDAAASAIYGARAAYGVILVTTKKGKSGKANITYSGNVGWSSPVSLPNMANAVDFANFFNAAGYNATGTKQYSDEKIALLNQYMKDPTGMNSWAEINGNTYDGFENTANGIGNTDYFALHYKDAAVKQNHNLSLSGGGEAIQYYVSAGYYQEDGVLTHADIDYKRYNLNGNLTSKLNNWIKLKLNTKFANSFNKTPFGDGAIDEGMFFHNLARFRPTVSAYDLNGNFTELSQIPYLRSGTEANTENSNLGVLTGLEIEPIKDWKIFIDYNLKIGHTNYNATAIAPKIAGINGETYIGNRSELKIPVKGSYLRNMQQSVYNSINVYSTYSKSFASKHNLSATGGFQQDQYRYEKLQTHAKDLISPSSPGINLVTGDKVAIEGRNHWATRGFFGRINYDYEGKYLFEANARYDGSSRFSEDTRWGVFPSISVGYNIARESFMEKFSSYLSTLKFRGSYGYLGNQAGAGLYTFAETMGTQAQSSWYFENGRDVVIKAPGSFNPNATWEKIENINLGLDFALFQNQLTGSLDVYQRKTKDMLGPNADFADFYGSDPPKTNNATMRNRGWELSINWRGKITNDIEYSIGGMISDYNSEILEYENPTKLNPAGDWYVGKKDGEIWGYRASGLIQTQAEADDYNTTYDTSYLTGREWKPGDVKYLDLNGDKKIDRGGNRAGDMGDMEIIGNSQARYLYSLNGSIEWKNLSISMLWQGVGKRDYNPGTSPYFWGSGSFAQVTVFDEHLDYWRGSEDPNPNPNAYYPNPYASASGAFNSYSAKTMQTSDRYLQNGAFIRLKNLTVNYDLPSNWMNKIKMSNMSIFFSGENLLTFTKLAKMFDPETAFSFNEGGKAYPINRVYSIGLILKL